MRKNSFREIWRAVNDHLFLSEVDFMLRSLNLGMILYRDGNRILQAELGRSLRERHTE